VSPTPHGARLALLASVLPVVCIVALGTGPIAITPHEVLAALGSWSSAGADGAQSINAQSINNVVILSIRLPRVLLGVLVGASISVAGAALQGLFRNPLAEPGLIGVSGGAALAAAAAIVLGAELAWLLGPFERAAVPVAAFAGGFLVTLLVYRLGTHAGRTNVTVMLLAGVAVQALTVSGIGFLQYLADDNELRDLTFWMLGSLGGASWRELGMIAPWMIGVLALIPMASGALNAMLLGEAEARHLGYEVQTIKRLLIVACSIAVGSAVFAAGIIAFVGLVVPHLVRLMTGPDHRLVLPGSMLLGATLIVAADAVARTAASPAELPIGVLFAALGVPFFLWLLYRGRNRGVLA
jgi:iron complex transport system permease protein